MNHKKQIANLASIFIDNIETKFSSLIDIRSKRVGLHIEKILQSFKMNGLGSHHFSSSNGYAHSDIGRDVIDKIYASIFGAEKAAVRLQFVSGTHAIACCLFGTLRPGDNLLSISGKPYDTLEEVIGLRKKGQGSLIEFGVNYEESLVFEDQSINYQLLDSLLALPRKLIFFQRSCGYSWRSTISIQLIQEACTYIHKIQPQCICFVDNCYGEFVEENEPTLVGADLMAGSLIKNPGGTIVPTGGYVAGRADLVEQACCRLTSPGIGSSGGMTFDLNRIVLQGLFLAPQMVSEALIGADIIAGVFSELGFAVNPLPNAFRGDLIQAIRFNSPEALKIVCKAFQDASPVGSYLNPMPGSMPGYESDLIMAGGTFVEGSTSEFSADGPLRPPFNLFVQGGTHRAHIKIAIRNALIALCNADLINLDQMD